MFKFFKTHANKFLFVGAVLVVVLLLDYKGIIWHNAPFAASYDVKGLDVSGHQGNIDWKKVAEAGRYRFVFIKATEGHDFTDDYFQDNWKGAKENGLMVGAYHFFSVRSSAKEQFDLFRSVVPVEDSSLPPVIDIEIDVTKDKTDIRKELQTLVDLLEMQYKKRPILYVTYDTYWAYVEGYFSEYQIWIRDIFKPPYISDRPWLFWQYGNRGHIDGINTYVDLNVFKGTEEDLELLSN